MLKSVLKLSKKSRALGLAAVAMVCVFNSSGAQAAVVTIEGEIDKVVAAKKEIYVIADGKKHEFYFSDKTEITKAGEKIGFETLKKAMKVKVTADKVGKRLDPLKVELVD